MTDTELLKAAITKSGLSAVRYATDILIRDPRSVRRWLAGGQLPQAVRTFLEAQMKEGIENMP